MGIAVGPGQLRRYADIVRLLVKYGRSDLVRSAELNGLALASDPQEPSVGDPRAEDLAGELERMGPTFIKLGQLLSTRADLLPVEYMEALARLQDDVEPFDSAEAEALVETELGTRISKAFSRFDRKPMAAASLGQVHYAELRDGRPVAVKIQRPHVQEEIAEDLKALFEVARLLDGHSSIGERYDLEGMIREFQHSLLEELDYRKEAQHLKRLGEALARFDKLLVPCPIEDYTTSRVLTMEFVSGRKITSLSPLARMEMDGHELAAQLFEAYLHQILVDGFFHADPHPGNLFITSDMRVALLDLGMVGRTTPRMQEDLLALLLAISGGQGEKAAEVAVSMGEPRARFDPQGFSRAAAQLVSRQEGATVQEMEVGRIVIAVTRIASEHGIRLPAELTLLGKTLLNLDQVGRTLDSTFDPNAAIQEHAAEILQKRMRKSSQGQIFSTILEVNQLMQRLPAQLNTALDRFANNEMELRINAFDEVHLMEGLQKIANRIAMGVIVAALIVGAALLMPVETDFRLLGYPGLAILLFLAAVTGGLAMMVNILRHDESIESDGGTRHRGPSPPRRR